MAKKLINVTFLNIGKQTYQVRPRVVEVGSRARAMQEQRFPVERPSGVLNVPEETNVPLLPLFLNYCLPFASVPGNTNHGRHRPRRLRLPWSPLPVLLFSRPDHRLVRARQQFRHVLKEPLFRNVHDLPRDADCKLLFFGQRSFWSCSLRARARGEVRSGLVRRRGDLLGNTGRLRVSARD